MSKLKLPLTLRGVGLSNLVGSDKAVLCLLIDCFIFCVFLREQGFSSVSEAVGADHRGGGQRSAGVHL